MKTADGHEITVGMKVWIKSEHGAFMSEILGLDYLVGGCCRIWHTEPATNYFAHEWNIFATRIAALNNVIQMLEDYLSCAQRELQEAEHEEYIKREALEVQI